MKLRRRALLHFALASAALALVSSLARAETYPTRPVRVIVGFAPGGSADITGRLIGQWLSERLHQQFLIENRPGAGTNIATANVIEAPPDGYTLLFVTAANFINATLYEKLPFNFMHDITPVAVISREPGVMVVHPSMPAKTISDFIAYAKANPGRITMASGGIGAPSHVSGELFKMMAGVDMVHVPYRGAGPAVTDLLGGQVQVYFTPMSAAIEHIRAGKLRALAVTTEQRSPALPDIPAVAEFVPGYEASQWYGIGAPRNTPAEIVAKLNSEINAGLADAGIKAQFADLGGVAAWRPSADFRKLVAEQTEKWAQVIGDSRGRGRTESHHEIHGHPAMDCPS
jgi:tripartite-type tricarboxylate transporter receptor subunit TctC